jgi:hypothetical protein
MVHEPVKGTIDEKPEKKPRYEMRPRKFNLSIDLNRPIVEEENGIKNVSKVKENIKPKIEDGKDMNDNNLQIQALKQHNHSMRQ